MSDKEFVETGLLAAIQTASNLEKRIAELERENAALRDALQSIRYRMPSDEFIEDHDAVAVSTFKQIKKILNAVQKEAQP